MVSFLIGYTTLATHKVNTQDHTPFKQAAYQASYAVQESVQNIPEMLDLGVIDPSKSHWDLLVALVPKEDGTTGGSMTGLLPMPIPCPIEELLKWIAHGHFLTTRRLQRVLADPLEADAVPKLAYITPFGLYQFRITPFGMKNALATFQRMVDKPLDGLQDFYSSYVDDIAVCNDTWKEHLRHLGRSDHLPRQV